METIILDLRSDYQRTFKKWFGVIVVMDILVGIIFMLTSVIPINYFLVLSMVLLLGQVIANWYSMKPVKVIFDDKGIVGSVSPRKTISLMWDQITRIEVHMFAMDIQTKDGRTEHIDLSEITYEQQKSIKPRIIELARSKGINVQAV
jgi:hypothetical protein